jgi:hypothetical protein
MNINLLCEITEKKEREKERALPVCFTDMYGALLKNMIYYGIYIYRRNSISPY